MKVFLSERRFSFTTSKANGLRSSASSTLGKSADRPASVLEDGRGFGAFLHDLPHHLALAYPVGDGAVGLGPEAQPPPGLPVDICVMLRCEFFGIYGGVKRRFQTQRRELLLHPSSALHGSFEIDNEHLHGRVPKCRASPILYTPEDFVAYPRVFSKPLASATLAHQVENQALVLIDRGVRRRTPAPWPLAFPYPAGNQERSPWPPQARTHYLPEQADRIARYRESPPDRKGQFVLTHGQPQAIASIRTPGKPSYLDERTNSEARFMKA